MLPIDLEYIENKAASEAVKNDHFTAYVRKLDSNVIDPLVHDLNKTISSQINCTDCGNCCNLLVINVEDSDVKRAADGCNISQEAFKETYLEESLAGKLFMNSVPCHFLTNNKCTFYEYRFTDCREFPHLHKPNFKDRLPFTMMYYGKCPIIYNVVEALKEKLNY